MKRFRLTPMQETMLFEAAADPSRYMTTLRYELTKSIDAETLDRRLEMLAARHETLRSSFVRDGGVLWQEVTDRIDAELFRAEVRENELTVTFHHALLDGWSVGIIMRELLASSLPDGKSSPFRYYTKWLGQRDYSNDLRWWKQYLDGANAGSAPPNAISTTEYERRGLLFTLENPELLRQRAVELKITAGHLLRSLWCMLMARYNGGESVVCTVSAGRSAPVPGIMGMAGMCLNTLPIVTKLLKPPESICFADWVSEWSGQTAQAEKHGFCALGDLVSAMPHLLTTEPAFDGEGYTLKSSSARLVTDFDAVITLGDIIKIEFAYNARVYSDEAVSLIREHFLTALDAVLENPQIPMERIPILTGAEVSKLTALNEDKEILDKIECRTVVDFWRGSAMANKDNTALVCGDVRLTYAELAGQVDRLSSALRARGVGAETPVAILLPRSEKYVIAELAVMSAGGMFVPLDSQWPKERIQTITDEVKPHIVIDDAAFSQLLTVDCQLSTVHRPLPVPADAAYMIMTSGTTGVPKGVVVTHRNLANFCLWVSARYGWRSGGTAAMALGFGFDGSIWSIFPPLISGGTLHILPDDIRFNISALGAYCKAWRITHIDLPVTLMDSFREIYRGENALPDLRVTVTGGEQVRQVVPAPYPLSNEYGPTECTVACCTGWLDDGAPITVGSPVPNMNAYIMDEWGRLCPDGVTGEAYFAGVQVARGYYNAPGLTAEHFVDNPFSNNDNYRTMYRTGDLMKRVLGTEELIFMGRVDNQVKISGFRVELGEIERVLLAHPRVSAVHTAIKGIDRLCSYVVPDGNVDIVELNKYLASKLPFYMRPAIVLIESIPMTSNGKVDTDKLPLPEARDAEYAPPATSAEKALIAAVSQILNIEDIGTDDNYIALGGNSINAMRIAFRLESEGWELAAKELIISGSFAEAAGLMRLGPHSSLAEVAGSMQIKPHNGKLPPSNPNSQFIPLAAQQAMFFLTQTTGPDMYAVTLKVSAPWLDEDTLVRRLGKAAELHDILRSTFELDEAGRIVGRVRELTVDGKQLTVEAEVKGGELTLRYHHISLDGWSVNLLLDELLHGKFPKTAPSFAAFANKLAAQTDRQAEDGAWWREQCKNAGTVPLPPPKAEGKSEFKRVCVNIPGGLVDAAKNARVTPAAFVLTAWSVVLSALDAGDRDILIPFAASCRDDDRLMGMCAAAIPLKFRMTGGTFGDLACRVQNAMLECVSHWFVPQDIIGKLPRYLFVFEDGTADYAVSGEQNYDLVVKSSDKSEIIYNAACIPEAYAGELADRLGAALTEAVRDGVSAFREGEYELITKTFTRGRTLGITYPTAAGAFTAAVKAYSGCVALETENETFTYEQIYGRARQYANELNAQGVGAGDIVDFCLPRGADAIIVQLGIALSGAAFLPLDPEWPEGRRDDILSDTSGARLPSDAAYVLYTSGSTGKPKGVVIPQSALANQIAWTIDEFKLCPGDKVLHYVAFTFDPSVWTIFAALCSGAALSVIPEHTRLDPDEVTRYIREKEITVCVLPASLVPGAWDSCLRTAFIGGEPIKNLPPNRTYEVINCYGPTEACVNASFYRLKSDETQTRNIGRPVANTQCYVLDARKNPCPISIQGELHIGGVQLAHGYLNCPEETAAAFTEHPLFGRLYKTGDLAAWNEDGTLEFIGRRDSQVKIRGNRVELGEIETALCDLPGVSDARVKLSGGAIDAYIIGEAHGKARGVRQMLARRLPLHMLPRTVTVMDSFPLTENGKVDFAALPEPKIGGRAGRGLSEIEEAVAAAWKAALDLPDDFNIAPGDGFYELGGHSLLLFHVVGLLVAEGITVDIKTLIEHPVLEDLAAAIIRGSEYGVKPANKGHRADESFSSLRYRQYITKMDSLDLTETRSLEHVLITGGTGFLGSHLVREFYENTGAVIHLPVRDDIKKLSDALVYYFRDFGEEIAASERIHIFKSDISAAPPEIHAPPDAIFHTAADIRHYAPEPEMYKANVTATENMLELAARYPGTLLAHISTTGAVNAPVICECDTDPSPAFENIYQRTKQLAEQRVLEAGKSGLKYAVFRIGHVSPGYESGCKPRNWEINAMLRLINAMLLTGLLPERDYKIGYGYADKVARALRLLSAPDVLENLIFHIDNPNTLRLSELFKLAGLSGRVVQGDELIAQLEALIEKGDGITKQAASEYLGRLAQGGVEKDSPDIVAGEIRMDATLLLLGKLGFEWPRVTAEYMQGILLHLKGGMPSG